MGASWALLHGGGVVGDFFQAGEFVGFLLDLFGVFLCDAGKEGIQCGPERNNAVMVIAVLVSKVCWGKWFYGLRYKVRASGCRKIRGVRRG